jgi:L-alanine-DL-glutamate epimerase-like enolase superfamily enzyme
VGAGQRGEAELAGYAAKGFTAAKIRVVGRDGFSIPNCVRRVKAARRGLGPDVELMIDAHGSLEVATAIKLARELEPYDIAWFEEPVSPDDHAGQAEVRRSTTIPIASGEREFTRFDFADLLERRALDIAQPDVARAGGMTEIRRIAASITGSRATTRRRKSRRMGCVSGSSGPTAANVRAKLAAIPAVKLAKSPAKRRGALARSVPARTTPAETSRASRASRGVTRVRRNS